MFVCLFVRFKARQDLSLVKPEPGVWSSCTVCMIIFVVDCQLLSMKQIHPTHTNQANWFCFVDNTSCYLYLNFFFFFFLPLR